MKRIDPAPTKNAVKRGMSIIEVAVSISIMGTIALLIGNSFSSINATHQISDDLVDARRLIALQFALYDRAFNQGPARTPPQTGFTGDHQTTSDFLNWAPSWATSISRNTQNFPNLWARPSTQWYTLQLTAPTSGINTPPTDINAFIRGRATHPLQNLSTFVPAEPVLGNQWHAWNTLAPEEIDRLTGREITMDVYLARLEILDTHARTGDANYLLNPYRIQRATAAGLEHLWWIAQVDVVRRTGPTTTILESAFRIGP